MMSMQYLLVPSMLVALGLPLSVIAGRPMCDRRDNPDDTGVPIGTMYASAWYPGYAANYITPDMIPFNQLDSIKFAYAETTSNVSELSLVNDVTAKALSEVVQRARSNNISVLLTVGGPTGSQYFSTGVAPENITNFVKAFTFLVDKYDLDGIEIDWRYPNKDTGCNTHSPNDAVNLLAFFQQLRTALGSKGSNTSKIIAAAVGVRTWNDANGIPTSDVGYYMDVIDYITVMPFNIYDSRSNKTGPNSPLHNWCAPVDAQIASVSTAVLDWSRAGFYYDQIYLGVTAYGHSFFVNSVDAYNSSSGDLTFYTAVDNTKQPLGPGDPPVGVDPGKDQCGKPNTPSGAFTFSQLINQNLLTTTGTNATGIAYTFEECSDTPILYNPHSNVMVSFEDAKSLLLKGAYIADHNARLRGVSLFGFHGDYENILLNALFTGMGVQPCS